MKIIIKEENEKLFGSTDLLGIGKRQPKLIYGTKAKQLRENANLTIEQLAREFDIRPNIINKIESQQMSLDEKIYNKYMEKFDVNKDYFFDLDLETLILSSEGHILKSFETSEECFGVFRKIMEEYYNAVENGKSFIVIDFRDLSKFGF